LAECAGGGVRTYIGEQRRRHDRVWVDKPAAWEKAYRDNRRRCRGRRGKRLQKKRSEYAEPTVAHVCETRGARRGWLGGLGGGVQALHHAGGRAYTVAGGGPGSGKE